MNLGRNWTIIGILGESLTSGLYSGEIEISLTLHMSESTVLLEIAFGATCPTTGGQDRAAQVLNEPGGEGQIRKRWLTMYDILASAIFMLHSSHHIAQEAETQSESW